jgi:hypothetical protein
MTKKEKRRVEALSDSDFDRNRCLSARASKRRCCRARPDTLKSKNNYRLVEALSDRD